MSRLTVVVPFKDGFKFLPSLCQTLAKQTLRPDEIIFIDDHSEPPLSLKHLEDLSEMNIRVVLNSGIGVSSARNTGLRLIRMGMIAFLDCDDTWETEKLRIQIDSMRKYESNFSCVAYRQFNEAGTLLQERSDESTFLNLDKVITGEQVVLGSASGVVVSRDLVDHVGYFDETLNMGEDFDYWLRLLKVTSCLVVPEVLVNILRHSSSTQDSLDKTSRVKIEFESLSRILGKHDGFDFEKFTRLGNLLLEQFIMGNLEASYIFSLSTLSRLAPKVALWKQILWIPLLALKISHKILEKAKHELISKAKHSHPVNEFELYPLTDFSVTVLMATHRVGNHLESAVRTTLNSLDNVQGELLLVVDSIDIDKVVGCLETFSRDERLRIVPSRGRGLVDALNTGLDLAQNELIARMDSDDLMYEHRLQVQIEEFRRRENLVLLGGAIDLIDLNDTLIRRITYPSGSDNLKSMLKKGCFFAHPSVMFRKSAVNHLGGYDSRFSHAEDFELWTRLAKLGEIENIEEPIIRYRSHIDQVSNVFRNEQEEASNRIIAAQIPKSPFSSFSRFLAINLHTTRQRSIAFSLQHPSFGGFIRIMTFFLTNPIHSTQRALARLKTGLRILLKEHSWIGLNFQRLVFILEHPISGFKIIIKRLRDFIN